MTPDDPRDEAAVRNELARVLASAGFARNARMSRFLRVLVDRHLAGRDDELKESLIAIEVFGRKPDYDPKVDSIVRTEAARLRARLIEYYAGEGQAAPLAIDVPKGSYIPAFRTRDRLVEPEPARSNRRWLIAALAGVAVIVASASWWTLHARRTPISIAVLPLVNLSHEPSSGDFVDGLTDEIIRNLSVIEGLQVRSRTSSFALKNQPRDVRETGTRLGVDYLVEGSVLRDGARLRIDAQLIRVRDDSPLWSGQFDRQLTDIFAIQDEISLAIVNNLRLQLGRGRRRYETSVAAYELYLEALAKSMTRGSRGAISITAFEHVIAKDASFAPAYAGLASAYALRSVQFPLEHPADELARMRSAAETAIRLDPLLAEAHAALALSEAREGQWDRAERSFRRAIELNPNQSRARADFAFWFLDVLGRNDEALEQLRRAQAADPLSSVVQLELAWVLMSLARYDEAAAHCAQMSADDGLKSLCLGRARIGQGRLDEAIQVLTADPKLSQNPQTRGVLGYALARSSRRAEAEDMAAISTFANEQALIYAGLGDKDRTLDALERMASAGAQRIGLYLNGPEMAFLRGDPRVLALRGKVGLPE